MRHGVEFDNSFILNVHVKEIFGMWVTKLLL